MTVVSGYTSSAVDSLTTHFGAEMRGVNLGEDLCNEQFNELYQARLD